MDNIVILGTSGHAKVIIDIVEHQGCYKIVGLIDRDHKTDNQILNYQVIGRDEDLPQLMKAHSLKGAIVAIGDNYIRSKVVNRVRDICPLLPFVKAIHPYATVANGTVIGEGSVVMAGVVINTGSSIGRFCIVNTNASLDHDSQMEEFSSLAPRVSTGGNCRIGCYSAIGIGAILIQGINIGEHTIIGAGSTVLKDIDSFTIAFGTPAKAIRSTRPL